MLYPEIWESPNLEKSPIVQTLHATNYRYLPDVIIYSSPKDINGIFNNSGGMKQSSRRRLRIRSSLNQRPSLGIQIEAMEIAAQNVVSRAAEYVELPVVGHHGVTVATGRGKGGIAKDVLSTDAAPSTGLEETRRYYFKTYTEWYTCNWSHVSIEHILRDTPLSPTDCYGHTMKAYDGQLYVFGERGV